MSNTASGEVDDNHNDVALERTHSLIFASVLRFRRQSSYIYNVRPLLFMYNCVLIQVMVRAKQTKPSKSRAKAYDANFDGVYLMKMALYLLVGSVWIKISNGSDIGIPVPIGLIIGLVFTLHEHFQIDRKIEYAILLVAMLFGYFAPYGLYVSF